MSGSGVQLYVRHPGALVTEFLVTRSQCEAEIQSYGAIQVIHLSPRGIQTDL